MAVRIPKTRNAGTMTEAAFFGKIRSDLRRGFRFWKPLVNTKLAARRPNESDNKRMKWEYLCNHCGEWFPDKGVQVDHIEPTGSLKCFEDLAGFVERLAAEDGGYQLLCKPCHQVKTNEERNNK